MAYSATVRLILISCPGDVPQQDLAIVRKQIYRWNVAWGPRLGTVLLPVSWSENAAAELGAPAQKILDQQLIDDCDCCIALFANRLGTPYGDAASGTAHEIDQFIASSRYVAVLRSRRKVDAAAVDHEQAAKLGHYLAAQQSRGIILQYRDDAELIDHVVQILVRLAEMAPVGRPNDTGSVSSQADLSTRPIGVQVRLDAQPRPERYGEPLVASDWHLVVQNAGDTVATNVRIVVESLAGRDQPWLILGSDNGIYEFDQFLPGQNQRLRVIADQAENKKARCTVSWSDDKGDHVNEMILSLDE